MSDLGWLSRPAAILGLCLGLGSCGYLWSAGDARMIEARATLKAAEKCEARHANP